MNDIEVSVWCLTYNQAPYIKQCLDGFIMQKTNFKFVAYVHDDASTDGTTEIVCEYAKRYPEIIIPIIETENQWSKHDGTIDRIFREKCITKYIAICEGDDYWTDPLKLQKQYNILESDPTISLCHHDFKILRGDTLTSRDIKIPERQDIINIAEYNTPQTLTMFYRNIEEPLVPDDFAKGRLVWQFFWNVRLAEYGDVYYINEPMGVYRLQSNGVYAKNDNYKKAQMGLANNDNMIEWFTNWHPKKNVVKALKKRARKIVIKMFLSRLRRLKISECFDLIQIFYKYI